MSGHPSFHPGSRARARWFPASLKLIPSGQPELPFSVYVTSRRFLCPRSIIFLPVEYHVSERDSDVHDAYAYMLRVRIRTMHTYFQRRENMDTITTQCIVLSWVCLVLPLNSMKFTQTAELKQ